MFLFLDGKVETSHTANECLAMTLGPGNLTHVFLVLEPSVCREAGQRKKHFGDLHAYYYITQDTSP